MVKAADTFANAGYEVRVVSTQATGWAIDADADLLRRRQNLWRSTLVDYSRATAPLRYYASGLRFRAAELTARSVNPARLPLSIVERARSRAYPELVAAVTAERTDLVYGGGNASAAAATSASILGVPFALDLEDFHSAEEVGDTIASSTRLRLTSIIESAVLPRARFLTGGSEGIAREYERTYAVRVHAINNVFELDGDHELSVDDANPLRLYWFSQTISPGRGLEEVVAAAGRADCNIELHVRGLDSLGFLKDLRTRARDDAPALDIHHHTPGLPDDMVTLARGYDVGIAAEQAPPHNRAICLSNKLLLYLVAGIAVAATETEGQKPVIDDLGVNCIRYAPGDVQSLSEGLRRWHNDRPLLRSAKRASAEAARTRWNWAHPDESGRLMSLVRSATGESR